MWGNDLVFAIGRISITSEIADWGLRHHMMLLSCHDDVIKWKHFPRYWPFVRGIHLSPVNSPHKGKWRGAVMFTLICPRINGWVSNCEAGDLSRNRSHYDVIVMNKAIAVCAVPWPVMQEVFPCYDVSIEKLFGTRQTYACIYHFTLFVFWDASSYLTNIL